VAVGRVLAEADVREQDELREPRAKLAQSASESLSCAMASLGKVTVR